MVGECLSYDVHNDYDECIDWYEKIVKVAGGKKRYKQFINRMVDDLFEQAEHISIAGSDFTLSPYELVAFDTVNSLPFTTKVRQDISKMPKFTKFIANIIVSEYQSVGISETRNRLFQGNRSLKELFS